MVTTLSLDPNAGTLKELDSVSALPPDTKLVTGAPRGAVGTPGANLGPRNTDNDIWASDLHLTPNGRFLYAAERTSSTLGAFRVDTASEALLNDTNVEIKAVQDIQTSYSEVIGVKIENLVVNAPSAVVAFVHAVVEPLKALCSDGRNSGLVIVLDGLDEATQHLGRETIVGLLANAGEFPRQVRWLLTSRIDAAVLSALETRPLTPFVLGEQTREASLRGT